MSLGRLPADCPYNGLVPYSEADAPFFFGRETERDLIIATLLGSRVTVLYGPSGVGKTSLLEAGVGFGLRELARQNLALHGAPELAVATFRAWKDRPLAGLLQEVREAAARALGGATVDLPGSSLPWMETLRLLVAQLRGELVILLDQFEDYLTYHPSDDGPASFFRWFVEVVSASELQVSFLVAIRDDSLALLDRFKGSIPALFDNHFRLKHLSRAAGRKALFCPLEEYNRRVPGQGYEIETELVEAVLDEVAVGKLAFGEPDHLIRRELLPRDSIEASYLQLVMTHLWAAETTANSRVLRLETLRRLGSAKRIVVEPRRTTW